MKTRLPIIVVTLVAAAGMGLLVGSQHRYTWIISGLVVFGVAGVILCTLPASRRL